MPNEDFYIAEVDFVNVWVNFGPGNFQGDVEVTRIAKHKLEEDNYWFEFGNQWHSINDGIIGESWKTSIKRGFDKFYVPNELEAEYKEVVYV